MRYNLKFVITVCNFYVLYHCKYSYRRITSFRRYAIVISVTYSIQRLISTTMPVTEDKLRGSDYGTEGNVCYASRDDTPLKQEHMI
jgi:hypothetical protein